jgi:2-dehydropantoate 2-reductase
MRIAVIGTGGIGGPYGASLAKAGANVTFVARGAHLAAIRENGLRIEGDRGETHIRPAQATDNIASIGNVDFALCSGVRFPGYWEKIQGISAESQQERF